MITIEIPIWLAIIILIGMAILTLYFIVGDLLARWLHNHYQLEFKEKKTKKERTKKMRLTEEGTMNKGLEALEELRKQSETHRLLEQQFEKEWLNTIEKELKALEIIKKYIDVNKPYGTACYIYLNDESEMISEEEYNLLKEVLM